MHRRYFIKSLLALFLLFYGNTKAAYAQEENSTYAKEIERVLAQDQRLSDQLKIEANRKDQDSFQNLVVEMGRIDLRGCPPDFQEAYLQHASAWGNLSLSVAKAKERYRGFLGMGLAFLEGFNEDHRFDDKYELETKEEFSEIQATWQRVKLVALKYGANTAQ